MALKIGLVTGEFPPMEGGVGAFTSELAIALNESGHEVHIITDRRARPEGSERDFWNPRDPHGNEYANIHSRVNRWWWAANGAVVDVTLRYDLDIVNIQYQAAAFDMRIPAINFLPWRMRELAPTVVTFHDLRHPYLFPKAGRLRNWVVYRLARSAEGVITTNAEDHDRLLNSGVDPHKVAQIPIGSNVMAQEVAPGKVSAVRQSLGLAENDYLLGYFGFINPSKGPDILLQALAQLSERFHLVFIGGKLGSSDPTNERYLAHIEGMIRDLDLQNRVFWSGFLEEAELSAHLEACDTMVMPYRDGVSLRRGTLMAILAHGRPLVTTPPRAAGTPLIHGQNVWLTPVDDPAALRDAIRSLANDRDQRQRLGRGAKQVSEQFSWDKIAVKTLEFYQAVISGDLSAVSASPVAR